MDTAFILVCFIFSIWWTFYVNCFRWLNNLFKKGNKGELEDSDIYDVLPEDATKGLADELER
jgi:hypothetical protein